MTATEVIDASLRRVKAPLRACRERYEIEGDVRFWIRYAPTGDVTLVTIDDGPPNMSAAFIAESIDLVTKIVRFPLTETGGELMFTDLGLSSSVDAAARNQAMEVRDAEREAIARQARRKRDKRIALGVGAAYVAWIVVQVIFGAG